MFVRCTTFILVFAGFMATAQETEVSGPTGTLTLVKALDAALANNPELAAMAWDPAIAGATTLQAGLRPNPEVSVELENIDLDGAPGVDTRDRNIGFSADGLSSAEISWERESAHRGVLAQAEVTLQLSQVIELGGKRAARLAAARKGEEVASWDYEVARYRVMGEVFTRFTEVLAAQERIYQAQQLQAIAESVLKTVAGKVETGDVAPLEKRRTRAEVERLRIDTEDAQRALEQARVRLAATWGAHAAHFDNAAGDLTTMSPLPSLDTLLESRKKHPALERWAAELARREAVIAREEAAAVPDLTVSLGYKAERAPDSKAQGFSIGGKGAGWSWSETDLDDAWNHSLILEASIPLPIFDRNQGNIRGAELEAAKAADERRAADAVMAARLAEYHTAADAALARARALESRVVTELETALEMTREGYTRGKFPLLDLLDAERALMKARLDLTDARIAYHRALAQLERTLGTPLTDINANTNTMEARDE